MSEPYISDINSLLDRYIEKREIGEEIYPILEDLLNEVEKLSEEAYEKINKTFLKVDKQEDLSNFLFFHSTRNLRLTTLKIIDQFKLAKAKQLNPSVAKNLKQFISFYVKFLFFLRVIQEENFPMIDLISKELENFKKSAKNYSFLCSTNEELEYDKIKHKDLRELINSLKDIKIDAMHWVLMNRFRFSCDTNVLISSSFYYRFQSLREVFKEDNYELSIFIMRYFERLYHKNQIKFGILTPSTLQEINNRKLQILKRKLEERYRRDATKLRQVLIEMSAVLNKIDENLARILLIFQKGRAYFNNTRVKKIYNKVEAMYNDFIKESTNLVETIEKKVSDHIEKFYPEHYKNEEDLKKIEINKEIARQTQIFQLSIRGSEVSKTDKEILAEVIYEKKRCIQENTHFRNDFDFYFISDDTHFSEKYINSFGGIFSRPITNKISEQFNVKCVRIKEFFNLLLQQQLNTTM